MLLSATFLLLGLALGKPVIPRDDTSPTSTPTVPTTSAPPSDQTDACATSSVSSQWLSTCNTTVFWPTSTDYFYGPTTGSGASAVTCNAQWVEYNGRADELSSLGATSTSTSYWISPTSTGACNTDVRPEGPGDPHTGPVTTLCDGITRALGPLEYLTDYWPGTGPCSTSMTTQSDTSLLYRSPFPVPTCELNTQDCFPIWQTYSSRLAAYLESVTTEIPGDTNSPIRPTQCPSTKRNYTEKDPCTNCHYLPDTATLFYWPVTTTDGGLCLQNGTTVTATPTGNGPNTAVVNGHTFISPSIYVSFTSIYARSNQRAHPGGSCGGDYEDVIISVNPEAVTSYRNHVNAKYPRIGTAYPFNFADFQPHTVGNYTLPLIPWDQYRGGSQCIMGGGVCSMIRNNYLPWMEIPDVMTQIDPRWTKCHRSWYIPPVSLVPLIGGLASQPTGVAKASSARAGAETAPAVPQPALAAPTPEATSNGRGR